MDDEGHLNILQLVKKQTFRIAVSIMQSFRIVTDGISPFGYFH